MVTLILPPYSHDDAYFGDPDARIAITAEVAALLAANARTLRRLAVPEIFLWDVPPRVIGVLTHLEIHAGGAFLAQLATLFAAAPQLEALDIHYMYQHQEMWRAITAHPDALPRLHTLKLWSGTSHDNDEEWGELAHTAVVSFLIAKARTLRRLQLSLVWTHRVQTNVFIEALGQL